jgi:hypothetical protein
MEINNMDITQEESQAYQWAFEGAHNMDLVFALRRHVAAEMQMEFEAAHEEYQATSVNTDGILPWYCASCGQRSDWDERHNRLAGDWDKAAHAALSNGGMK